jgi:hypothetical protein
MIKNIIKIPEILIPKRGIDPSKWAVVACDQFTSEPSYWNDVEELTKNSPSAYHIAYPEIYLGKNQEERVEKINENMKKYLADGIFETVKGLILVERSTKYSEARFGLMMSVDLDAYDFKPFNKAYIKATEGTILERLPVRIGIRENAFLELPHILLLADNEKKSVIEPLVKRRGELKKLYDFELMKDGGHIKGYKIDNTESVIANNKPLDKDARTAKCGSDDINAESVIESIYKLLDKDVQTAKYGSAEVNFLFAVGDGNHSLATAKACWERLKTGLTDEEREVHPARYALVELMNLYDDALKFEPIHRIIFDAGEDFLEGLKKIGGERSVKVFDGNAEYEINADENSAFSGGRKIRVFDAKSEYEINAGENSAFSGGKKIRVFDSKSEYEINADENSAAAIKEIQTYIDEYLKKNPRTSVDYIHGEKHLRSVAEDKGGLAIIMPTIEKSELFPYVVKEGVLPKKAFSMGEAEEKRYYFEAKLIK